MSLFSPQASTDIKMLLAIMARLRDPENGCPWDKVQDFRSILPYTIEEAYEVKDAIFRENWSDLCDELGDLLLQVVFHAQIANDNGYFCFDDVVYAITSKLIRRHPHVFGEEKNISTEEVKKTWNEIKQLEKEQKKAAGVVSSTKTENYAHLPSLLAALKIQKEAASIGFDWENHDQVIEKMYEEIQEVKEAIVSPSPTACPSTQQDAVEEEIGDLFFVFINLARKLKVDPEIALAKTNNKFIRRFGFVQQHLPSPLPEEKGKKLEIMEELWQKAKKIEKDHK